MPQIRATPDEILRKIEQNDDTQPGGKLKIFFGYAAGVGKTYAMLEAAHAALEQGVDVVAGYIEPHTRPPDTASVGWIGNIAYAEHSLQGHHSSRI